MPRWEIYGADISSVAVGEAQERFPDCHFTLLDDVLRDGAARLLTPYLRTAEHLFGVFAAAAKIAATGVS